MSISNAGIKSRLGYAAYPRRRLLHILNTNAIDTMSVFALELIQLLPEYGHTVRVYGDPRTMDHTWMLAMQAAGVNLLHDDVRAMITHSSGFGAVVAYDVPDVRVSEDVPAIYYQYHNTPIQLLHPLLYNHLKLLQHYL